MLKKILIIILTIWFILFAVDIITSISMHHPIFMFKGHGLESQPYYGLGYSITFFDGMTPTGFYYDKIPYINPWIYILINVVCVLLYSLKDILNKRDYSRSR